MRYVPAKEETAWRQKAMEASEKGDLSSQIELWLENAQFDRLVSRLRSTSDKELEDLSHYQTEPLARKLERSHPDISSPNVPGTLHADRECRQEQVLRRCARQHRACQKMLHQSRAHCRLAGGGSRCAQEAHSQEGIHGRVRGHRCRRPQACRATLSGARKSALAKKKSRKTIRGRSWKRV